MIELGQHAGYIVAAYAGAGLVLALLVGRAIFAHRSATARIAALEARGLRRAGQETPRP